MPSIANNFRPLFQMLRHAGIDIQSAHRRDALNPFTVQQRLLAGVPVNTVLDCGAHHGRVARKFDATFPNCRVHSFEPTPATFDVLKREVAQHARITPINAAVGETDGTMDFYISPVEQSNSLLPRHPGHPERENKVSVRVRRLDEYCLENQLDSAEILKLDVEGYEGPALRGCGRLIDDQKIDVVYAETRFDPEGGSTTFLDLCTFLAPRGYQFFGFYDPMFTQDLQFSWGDVMFVSSRRLSEYRR